MQIEEYIKEIHGCIHIISEIIERQNGFKTIITKDNVIVPFENVVKHSKNIIDLIEVGDIVFTEDFNGYDFIHIYCKEILEALKEDVKVKVKIKSILTKEQYEANCYRLEE